MSAERHIDISLAQYAAVLAGLAEGHQLGRILACEGISPASWPDAEEAWSDRIAHEAGAEKGLQAEFDEHLATAQDRYGRRLPPLDEDLRAFLDFRRRWSTDPDPPALLARLGLRVGEVARLSRLWSTRLASDPALAEQAQGILRDEPGELPVVTPVAVELPAAPRSPEGEHAAPPDDDEPTAEDELPAFAPVTSGEASDEPGETQADGLEAPAIAAAPSPTAPARRPRPSFMITTAFVAPMSKPALPFRSGSDAASRSALAAARSLAATAAFTVPSFAPVLPFGGQVPTTARADAQPDRGTLPTAPLPVVAPAAALPFPAPDAARDAAAVAADAPSRAARPFTETATFEAISLAAVLPFVSPGAGEATVPPPGDAVRVSTEPDRGAGPTGTAPMPAVSAVPEAAPEAVDRPASAAPAEPSLPRATTTKLSVGAYAAFCAELAAFPGQFVETFQRYGLASPQEGIDLASAWQERFRQVPAEFETWQKLHRFYLDQCRTQGRPEVKS
jgi:hypothetical protein